MIARSLNVLLHPALIGFVVALYTAVEHEGGLTRRLLLVAAMVSGLCLFLPLLVIFIAAKAGWTDGDVWVERRENRRFLYAAALIGLAGSAWIFTFFYPFWLAQRMTLTAGVVTLTLAIANRWLKPSIHVAGDAAIAVAIWWTYGALPGLILMLAVPTVAWARVSSERHTPAETLVGAAIGLAATAACLSW